MCLLSFFLSLSHGAKHSTDLAARFSKLKRTEKIDFEEFCKEQIQTMAFK